MRAAAAKSFASFSVSFEGLVPWMYLDVLGLVTVGIGNLIDPMQSALGLPFVRRTTGAPATRDEIAREWRAVKRHPTAARDGHRVLESLTDLRLTPTGIDQLVQGKLLELESRLRTRWPEWDSWPADAQLGTLSMAWAMGPAFRFPTFARAARAKDWVTCAAECKMREEGNPGLAPRNRANRALFLAAAEAADPEFLHWPTATASW